jgi:mycofactocin system FadH/OYE family oxidoreductase 1
MPEPTMHMVDGLLDPLALGRASAPNRLVFGPHETNLCRGRAFSERSVAYYARRATGGCGVLITETASVHDSDWPYERAPLAAECGPGWAAIVAAVDEASPSGAVVVASLGHAGGQGSSAYSQRALWAPSPFPDPATREIPQAMELDEIEAVVAGFADAASLAVASGLTGVEINAGQLSLLRQFLSGLTNQRQDDYGTDRSLLVRRVVAAVRAAVGPGPVVGLRLGCDQLAPWAGITPEAAPDLAVALADGLDYVVAVRAPAFDVGGTRPDGHTEPGFAVPLADALRQVLPAKVAVMAQGSIVEAAMAEAILAAGSADLIEMTRAQIADPDLGAKLAAGVPEQVRPCVLCNQRCQVRDARNPLVSCIGEPFSGYESEEMFPSGPAATPLHVLVIGAGPAGLEAARVAATRGHRVDLVEAGPRPGGRLTTASAGAGRSHLADLTNWLTSECERLGVAVTTNRTIGAAELEGRLAEGTRVVLCAGARHEATMSAADGSVAVRTAADVLRAAPGGLDARASGPVVVADPVGDSVGVAVSELLAAQGRDVVLVTGDLIAGVQLSRSGDLAPANARLARAGVRLAKGSIVRQVSGGAVQLENTYTGEKEEVPAALLVEVTFGRPDDALWRDHPGLVRAGDAVAPRTAYEAVLEGRRAALGLEDPR